MAAGVTWTPHLRLNFGGSLGNGAITEEWSNTIRWKNVSGVEPTALLLQNACDALGVPLQAWFRSNDSGIHSAAWLSYIKLNWIGADGLQSSPNTIRTDFVPVNSFRGDPTPPFYQTFAITMRTRLNRGRAHAGRIFPPMVVHEVQAPGSPYQSTVANSAMVNAFVIALRGMRAALGAALQGANNEPTPDPAIFSPGRVDKGTQPLWAPVISAVIDKVPDVQHRRTRQIPRLEGTTVLLDPAV